MTLSKGGEQEELSVEKVLVGVGMTGNVDDVGIEDAGVETERGFITIDERMATNIPGVYAIGDVTGRMLLAHVASAQGVVAVEAIAGRDPAPLNYESMPRCTSQPSA